MEHKKLLISKDLGLDILAISLFFISFVNVYFVLVFYVFIMFSSFYGVDKCLKTLVLITVRGLMSDAVAVSTSRFYLVKWIIIFGTSGLIFLFAFLNSDVDFRKANKVVIAISVFAVYCGASAFITSSFPLTAAFKVFSFVVPFIAVILAMAFVEDVKSIIDYMVLLLSFLFAVSFLIIPFSRFRITNGNFQGVFNHVNMFGVMAAMYVAVLLASDVLKNRKYLRPLIVLSVIVMTYLSASRTGLFSVLLCVILYLLLYSKRQKNTVVAFLSILFIAVFVIFVLDNLGYVNLMLLKANDFIFKGRVSILSTRESQLDEYKSVFLSSPVFGRGFMVPYVRGAKNYSLSFSLVVEPGNIILALLAFSGIIGLVLFLIALIVIIANGDLKKVYLIFALLLINMGEMVFFSTNNMALLIYIVIGYYLFASREQSSE